MQMVSESPKLIFNLLTVLLDIRVA